MNNSHIPTFFLIIIVGSSNKISSQNRKTLPVFIRDWMHTLYCPKNGSPERRPSKFDRCPTRTKLAHQSNLPLESGSRIDEQCQHSGERTQMMQWKIFYLSVRSCPPNRLGADGNNLRAPHTTRVDLMGGEPEPTQLNWSGGRHWCANKREVTVIIFVVVIFSQIMAQLHSYALSNQCFI